MLKNILPLIPLLVAGCGMLEVATSNTGGGGNIPPSATNPPVELHATDKTLFIRNWNWNEGSNHTSYL